MSTPATPSTEPSIIPVTLLPSVLRTLLPMVYAMLVRWGVVEWLDPNDLFLTNFLTVLITLVFYVALRIAERHKAQIGWLLGYAQQPVYVKGEVISADEVPTPGPTTTTIVESTESKLDEPESDPPKGGGDFPLAG